MKRIATIMAGLALAGQMGAQHQYLDVNVGGGLQSLQHDPRLGDCTPGWGGNLNVGYTFYFSRHWGVGTGLGLAYYQAQSKIDGLDESKETDVVNNNRTYYLRNYYDGWEEHQQMLVGELPLASITGPTLDATRNWWQARAANLHCRYGTNIRWRRVRWRRKAIILTVTC
jgi:hypothetical protein